MRWNGFWVRRTQVARVELYSRISLYIVVWLASLMMLGFGEPVTGDSSGRLIALAWFSSCLAATPLVGIALERDPAQAFARIRVRSSAAVLGAVAVVWAVVARGLSPDEATIVVGVVGVALAVGFGSLPHRISGLAVPVAYVALVLLTAGPRPALPLLIVYYAGWFSVLVTLWMLRVTRELDTARASQARLAVAEERLRFSRDVHDVLGRHLSTIAVRSELAARLAERGESAAVEEMLGVREAAQEALGEARALARGYRATDLAVELEGARSLLASAGIDCTISGLDAVPQQWHEAAGWVVREAVTNVLRHSQATSVLIAATPDGSQVSVVNDGAPVHRPGDPAAGEGPGHGIVGLAERLAPLHATVAAGPERSGRFRLTATFQADPPAGPVNEERSEG